MPGFVITLAAKFVGERFAKLFAWAVLIILPLSLVSSCMVIERWKSARTAEVTARVGNAQTEAAIESGRDAVNTATAAAQREAATNAIQQENESAIRNSPGADAPVDPVLAGNARRGLCRYATYRNHPSCVQQYPASGVARPR